MKNVSSVAMLLGKFGSAIGKGLVAGVAGTAAISISQLIERKITNKPTNFAPGDAASFALGIEASKMENRKRFSNEVHWTYGTLWGTARGFASLFGLRGLPASSLHFAAIFYTALTVEPDFEVAPPINEWSKGSIATFGLHHLIYAAVAGMVFDAINAKQVESSTVNERDQLNEHG